MERFQLELIYLYFIEEIEIPKAASSKYVPNDVIAGQSDPIYKLIPTQWFELQDQQPRPSNQQKFKILKTKNYKISDLNSNCQLPKPGDRSNFNTDKTCW